MNPNYVHTITHYHNTGSGWTRRIYHGCYFRAVINVSQGSTEETVSNIYTARIPAEEAGSAFAASKGDIVIRGECAAEIGDASGSRVAEILRAHKPFAFRVNAVADNTDHLMDKHWRLGG